MNSFSDAMEKKAGWFDIVTGDDVRVPRQYNLSSQSFQKSPENIVIIFFMRSKEHEAGTEDTYWGDMMVTLQKSDHNDGGYFIGDYKISASALGEQFNAVMQLITELHYQDPETLGETLDICRIYFDEGMPPDIKDAYHA